MSLSDKLKALARRVPETVRLLQTEEATKNALVMPFIAALGYDVFDLQEVVPEYTADVGTKKGEKVDYAIMRDGEVVQKHVGLFDADKNETRHAIDSVEDLYNFAEALEATAARYVESEA
jgi:hypothetical protein